MKQDQVPPQWFTGDMEKSGMTVVVLMYLSGKLKKLKDSLSWIEFIFIWSVRKDAFEKTAFFQKKIQAILSPKKETSFMEEIKNLSNERQGKDFFMKFLPFNQLLSLPEDFWSCYHVFHGRAKTNLQKKEVLKKIREITAFQTLERDMLVQYFKMTKQANFDTAVAYVLVSQYLLVKPGDMYLFKEELDSNQIAGFCSGLKYNNTIDCRELFSLYQKSHSETIPRFLLGVLEKNPEKVNLKYLYQEIDDTFQRFVRDEESYLSVFREDWLPVLRKILTMPASDILKNIDSVLVLRLLPKYDPSNLDIISLFKKLVDEQKTRMYGMYYSPFPVFYAYAQEQIVLDAYLESLEKYPSHMFIKHMELYNNFPEERIVNSLVEFGIPTMKYAEENVIFFLDWLKSNRLALYERAKEIILSTGVVNTVWENAQRYDREKFVTFSSHFV